ncbi:replication initiator protein A [Staphylococcus aureus]|uniref:replication initiator protein A n=1 Tax=Staphylococcus aureus TaxID=1280 RepID=UPI0033112118|nr:replication initiator protein A [Staphylococcus aureus]
MSNQHFTIQENYKERFYQIPKVFFTNEDYKKLTNDSKIAYAILRDRLGLSIKNNWVDENGNIYFIYSNDKLMDILNCGKEKLAKIKKSLEKSGLLIQKRRGLNKANILYLMKPIVTENDIYEIEKEESDLEPSSDKEVRKSNVQKFENRTTESSKIERPEVRKSNTNDTDFSDTDSIDTENNDMNDLHDIENSVHINTHSNHSNHFSYLFGDNNDKEILLEEFPQQLTNYLLNYSYTDLNIIKQTILKAKKAFNSTHEESHFMLEDIEDELLKSLKRFKKAIHDREVKGKIESVKSMQGYLMTSILSELEELHSTEMRRKNFEENNIFNI